MRFLPTLPLVSLLFAVSQMAGAMGPDPGGHTGATVTPETTKTDRATVDSARKSNSGNKTETNTGSTDKQARKQ